MVSRPVSSQGGFRFGDDFELDVCAYELRCRGIALKLKPIPMEILIFLVDRRGELTTREQIVERIWGEHVFLDTNNSINSAISKVRHVLRDDPEQPRFVLTVPSKGYRFIAPVVEVPAWTSASQTKKQTTLEQATAPPEEEHVFTEVPLASLGKAPSPASLRAVRKPWSVFAVLALVLIAAAGALLVLGSRTQTQASGGRLMLAVLPFQNLTGDASQEYFSDGLTEEMITQMGKVDPRHLGVIARTSVMHYKNSAVPLDQVSRELRVQYVLEGSIRRESDRVRITAQLIQTKDQSHLWARQYDRELDSLLALEGEVAQEISDEILISLGGKSEPPTARRFPTPASFEVYELYLKGLFFGNKRTPQGFRQAISCFQQAIEKDPNYTRAYAGLADIYTLMSNYGLVPAHDYMPKARAAALKALQIDDSLAEAHASLAVIAENYDWDWQTANKEYRRAIELNPNYATAHHWYAECLAFQGRFDEALAESERARQLDPLSLIIAADNGAILYFSRQYDRAIERFRSVLDLDPGFTRAHLVIAAYVQKGQFMDALADIEAWRRTGNDAPWISEWETYVYGRAGRLREAQNALQRVRRLSQEWQTDPSQFMIVCYAGVNDQAEWLDWLEKATREHANVPTGFKVDPLYDPLRSNPRFQALLRRVGLADMAGAPPDAAESTAQGAPAEVTPSHVVTVSR